MSFEKSNIIRLRRLGCWFVLVFETSKVIKFGCSFGLSFINSNFIRLCCWFVWILKYQNFSLSAAVFFEFFKFKYYKTLQVVRLSFKIQITSDSVATLLEFWNLNIIRLYCWSCFNFILLMNRKLTIFLWCFCSSLSTFYFTVNKVQVNIVLLKRKSFFLFKRVI